MSEDLHAPPADRGDTNDFFGPDSPYLGHPMLTPERSAAEADAIVALCGLNVGDRIVDAGCGFGRHTVELAGRGLDVTAFDPSATMAAATRERLDAANLTADVGCHDGHGLEELAPFDAAIAMFTTIGQVGPDGANLDLIGRLAATLRPGGRLVVEVPQRSAAAAALVASEQFGAGDDRTVVSRTLDPQTNIVRERFDVHHGGTASAFRLAYVLLDPEELEAKLREAGFVQVDFQAGPIVQASLAAPLTADCPMMVAVATLA